MRKSPIMDFIYAKIITLVEMTVLYLELSIEIWLSVLPIWQ